MINNNYHTQLEKPKNMLNDIAANNKLLDQQSLYQGQFNQNTQQSLHKDNMSQQYVQQPQYNLMNANIRKNELDEIELSEPKQETKKKIDNEQHIEQKTNVKQFQQMSQPQMINVPTILNHGMTQDPINNGTTQETVGYMGSNQSLAINKNTQPQIIKSQNNNKTNVPQKNNNTMKYIITPIILLIVFIILVHPSTSKLLTKYIPPLTSMKGYIMRGLILVIVYYILIIFSGSKSKKN